MQKIVPHLWFNTEAKAAMEFYVSLFKDSSVDSVSTIKDTPSGDCDIVSFTLAGSQFMAISAGPYFTLNPAISFSVACESEEESESLWAALSEGGKVLMGYDTYPWAQKYGWVNDRFGVSWQVSWNENQPVTQKITPSLMFTGPVVGKAKEAIDFYSSIFPDSKTEMVMNYSPGEGDDEEYIKYARFTLAGQNFSAMDSTGPHAFNFSEAVSLVVNCDTQEEIDHYWEKLSAVPEAEQCGWLKDKYGVSWQIFPTVMKELMTDPERAQRVTAAFMKMKKFDIETLLAA